jgi:hypothetical protein
VAAQFSIPQTAPLAFSFSLGAFIQSQIQVYGEGLDGVSFAFFNPAGAFAEEEDGGEDDGGNLITLSRDNPSISNLNLKSGVQTITVRKITLTPPVAEKGGLLAFDGLYSDFLGGGGTSVQSTMAQWNNPETGVVGTSTIPPIQNHPFYPGFPASDIPPVVKEFSQTFTVTSQPSGPGRQNVTVTFSNQDGTFSPNGTVNISANAPTITNLTMQSGNQIFNLTSLLFTPPTADRSATLTLSGSYSNFSGGGNNQINSVLVASWALTDVNDGSNPPQ